MSFFDPSIASLGSSLAEAFTSALLNCDPGSKARLQSLAGKTIAIEVCAPNVNMHILFTEDSPVFSSVNDIESPEQQADLTLRGELASFVKLVGTKNYSLAETGVHAEGNVGMLQQLASIVEDLDIDWQDALISKFDSPTMPSIFTSVVNMATAPIASSLKEVFNFASSSLQNSTNQMSEFVLNESQSVISKTEFGGFSNSVVALQQRSERLEARIKKHFTAR